MSGGIPCLFCFATAPPENVKTKSSAKATVYARLIDFQSFPNTFDVSLGSACGADPCCCLLSGICAPNGCSACYYRDMALKETPGLDGQAPAVPWEYVCCQGYVPKCCCVDWPTCGQGNHSCLYLEGCCCPILSLSITRIFLMDKLQIQPDPGDYQLIQFSNCMQAIACICHIAAIIQPEFRDLAQIVDCIADIVTYSVAGCMGVQINTELKNKTKYANGVANAGAGVYVEGAVPVVTATAAYGAPPNEKMDR